MRTTRYEYGFDIDGDQTVETEEQYGWNLGTPLRTIVDPGASPHLNLITTTLYDPDTGELTERRLPAGPDGGTAHSTKHISWVAGATHPSGDTYCVNRPEWAGLPCKSFPAAQPGTAGMPDLPVTVHSKYNRYGQPAETLEIVGSFQDVRTTTLTYDAAGRPLTHSVTTLHDGTAIPTVTNAYSTTTGLPTTTTDGSTTITRAYDTLGRLTSYTDADDNTSTYTYDTAGRPATVNDGKGTQTISYNQNGERRGLPTTISDSVAGDFTATFDLDGQLATQTYPGGLTATYSYDEAGQPRHLDYTKSSNTWLTFDVEPSIHGQWADHTSTLSGQRYTYDAASRLTGVEDTVGAAGCTVRLYAFDADTNRTSLTTRDPNPDLTCATSGGTTVTSTYDAADRATLTGYTYDRFGRTTTIPAADSPTGNQTTIGYYVNDLTHTLTAAGATSTYTLDPNRRYRTWTQSTDNQTRTNHYTGDVDTPAWITEDTAGTTWRRHVSAFAGLAAAEHTQATGSVALQLMNLHGDIVAYAFPDATTFDPKTHAFETTEYGRDRNGTERRYQYLGRYRRHHDTLTGVTLMGARLYNPASGRFSSIDAIEGANSNPYDSVGGDPISRADPTGLAWVMIKGTFKVLSTKVYKPGFIGTTPGGVYSTNWRWHHDHCCLTVYFDRRYKGYTQVVEAKFTWDSGGCTSQNPCMTGIRKKRWNRAIQEEWQIKRTDVWLCGMQSPCGTYSGTPQRLWRKIKLQWNHRWMS